MEYTKSIVNHNPVIAHEWSIVNAFDKLPSTVSYGSNNKVFWECPKGHVYEASVKSRCVNHTGCPYCAGQAVLKGENDLATLNPKVAAEWNYEMNGDLKPDAVTEASPKVVWWVCACGHVWKASICDRTRKNYGCPYDSGRLVITGKTDLATQYPEIAEQWHPTLNGTLKPADVKPFSEKMVYWICPKCRHEWKARVADRCEGYDCPLCASKVVVAGVNDLQTTNLDLALQWNYTKNGDLLPTMVTAKSSKRAWWECPVCGHEWEAVIASRSAGRGCPCCSNKAVHAGINDLSTTNPALAAEWNYAKNGSLTPQMVTSGSGKEVWWRGPCGHEWKTDISNRNKGNGCPICSGATPLIGETDLATVNPDLADEWDYEKNGSLTPQMVTGMSGLSVSWKCINGHSWQARISNRATFGQDCPYCWGRVAAAGETDLATVHPEIAAQWHPTKNGSLTPQMVTCGSIKMVCWQCPDNPEHSWKATVNDRTNGKGCPICHNKKILVGENDLATTNPKIASQWHPDLNGELTPRMITAGSRMNVWWRCPENPKHIWRASVESRQNGRGCPICSNRQVLEGENDLTTTHPHIAAEWHPDLNGELTPRMVTAGSSIKAWWRCSANPKHIWRASVGSRQNGNGCPICSNRQVLEGENDLTTTHPQIAAEWHPYKNRGLCPEEVFAGSGRWAWWICAECGYEWNSAINYRCSGRGKCPKCTGYRVRPERLI